MFFILIDKIYTNTNSNDISIHNSPDDDDDDNDDEFIKWSPVVTSPLPVKLSPLSAQPVADTHWRPQYYYLSMNETFDEMTLD